MTPDPDETPGRDAVDVDVPLAPVLDVPHPPKELMRELRGWFEPVLAERLPSCRVLSWT